MTCRARIRVERKAVQRADASLRKHKEALRLSDAEKRKAELARLAQDHVDQAVKAMPDSGTYLSELYRALREHRKATRPTPKDAAEALFKKAEAV